MATDTLGYSTKELRSDPGSGARTWLLKIEPEAMKSWQRSTQTLEGYLLTVQMMETECNGEEAVTAEYQPGGYFYRPAGLSAAGRHDDDSGAVWFLRMRGSELIETVSGCMALQE